MDARIFLGGSEPTTLKELSAALGKETIDMYNTSVTKGTQESHGQNFQKLGKELASVDELAVLDGSKVHPPASRCKAVYVGQIRHHQAPELQIPIRF